VVALNRRAHDRDDVILGIVRRQRAFSGRESSNNDDATETRAREPSRGSLSQGLRCERWAQAE
jgi:hypothetical protein